MSELSIPVKYTSSVKITLRLYVSPNEVRSGNLNDPGCFGCAFRLSNFSTRRQMWTKGCLMRVTRTQLSFLKAHYLEFPRTLRKEKMGENLISENTRVFFGR